MFRMGRIGVLLKNSTAFSGKATKVVIPLCSVHSRLFTCSILEYPTGSAFCTLQQSCRMYSTEHDSSSSSSESASESEDDIPNEEYENNIRRRILDASLPFVHKHGWTKAAITEGAESIGYPGVITELFPLGASSLVLHFHEKCNEELRNYLESKAQHTLAGIDKYEAAKIFIADSIEFRLRLIIPYIDIWPQALALLTVPKAVPIALSQLMKLTDDIAHFAGDRSVDLDWYIRRVGIAGVYKVTELHMIKDKSADYKDTWVFLRRQLDDAVALYCYLLKSESAKEFTKSFSSATITTARNILGLNWNK